MLRKSKFGGIPRKLRFAAEAKLTEAERALDYFDAKLSDPSSLAKLSAEARQFIKSVRRPPQAGRGLPLSSRAVREAAGRAMIETTLHFAHRHRYLRKGTRRLRLLTICPDIGLVPIGRADYAMMRARLAVDRAVRKADLQSVGMLDLALFSPERGEAEHLAHIHSHHWISFNKRTFARIKDWVRALAPAKGNRNSLGGRVVTIRSKGSKKSPRLSPENVASLGWYTTKETCGVNTIYQTKKGQKSESSFSDWTFAGALRQLEFWSYVDARDAVWSAGHRASKMRTYWRRRLLKILELNALPLRNRIDVDTNYEGWKRVWRELNVGFEPIDPVSMYATRAPRAAPDEDDDEPW